jgi:hypothetical protein
MNGEEKSDPAGSAGRSHRFRRQPGRTIQVTPANERMTEIHLTTERLQTEVELLLCIARTRVDAWRVDRIKALLEAGLDWDKLISLVRANRMGPLIYTHLQALCPELVSTDILDLLHEHYRLNAMRNLFLTQALFRLMDLFQTNNISAIPFKGPVLAISLYGNLNLRQFDDLDILIHKRDLLRIKDLLISQGFRLLSPWPSKKDAIFLQCEHSFIHEPAGVLVDLHWAIEPLQYSFAPAPEAIWQRIEPVSLEGREIMTLSPRDLLICLCIHGARHGWERLDMICDLAEFLYADQEMDWVEIMRQSPNHGCERMISLGFFLANHVLGANLPEGAEQALEANKAVNSLAGDVCRRLFWRPNAGDGIFEGRYFYVRTMDRLMDKITHYYRQLVTPTSLEWTLVPLPSSLFFLYYFLRPLRLAAKYIVEPLRRIAHANQQS